MRWPSSCLTIAESTILVNPELPLFIFHVDVAAYCAVVTRRRVHERVPLPALMHSSCEGSVCQGERRRRPEVVIPRASSHTHSSWRVGRGRCWRVGRRLPPGDCGGLREGAPPSCVHLPEKQHARARSSDDASVRRTPGGLQLVETHHPRTLALTVPPPRWAWPACCAFSIWPGNMQSGPRDHF